MYLLYLIFLLRDRKWEVGFGVGVKNNNSKGKKTIINGKTQLKRKSVNSLFLTVYSQP